MKKIIIPAAVLFLIIAAAIPGYYFYDKYQKSQALLKNPIAAIQADMDNTIALVALLAEVPTDETPSVATITNPGDFEGQDFFRDAKEGDKLVVYSNAKRAVLYRPSTNRIIQMATISFNAQATAEGTIQPITNTTPTPTAEPVRVRILNGTDVVGLATRTQTTIEQRFDTITVTGTGNAVNRIYTQTLVVDISGANGRLAADIATALGGNVGTLPAGEPTPDVDILVITATR